MTVIVQPITVPPPETASDVIAQHLQKLLGTLTYENFAATPDGNITLLDTVFHYRVGLFLAVPTEAIIAAGQFVKMHQIKETAKYWTGLKVIDPDKPDDCLYERYDIGSDRRTVNGWCPPSLSAGVGQQSTLFAQNSLMVQQGIVGLGQLQAIQNSLPNQGQYLSQTAARQALKRQTQQPRGPLAKLFGR